jgi:hypothetical protein
MEHRAPLTLEVILRVLEILARRQLTREEFRVELNRNLPSNRQIKDNHSGTVQLNRWLNPTSRMWSEPQGEIALAMKQFCEDFENTRKNNLTLPESNIV